MLKGKVAFNKALSNKWFPMDKRAAAGLWMLAAWRLYLVGEGRLRSWVRRGGSSRTGSCVLK